MENLNLDEAIQLVNFYRQRSSDLELQVLQLQIKINSLMSEHSHEHASPVAETKATKTKSNS